MKKHHGNMQAWVLAFIAAGWLFPARVMAERMHCPAVTDNEEKNTETARRYFKMGAMFLNNSDFAKAAESFECVLKFVPYSLAARYKLATAYDGLGVYSKAREQYELILGYDSAEAESIKPEIRKRLSGIKGLPDRTMPAPGGDESPPTEEKGCPGVVQKSLQDGLQKAVRLLDAKDWAKGAALIEENLKKLDGATPAQRQECLSTEAGLNLLLHKAVANFRLDAMGIARDALWLAFSMKTDISIPAKYANAKLLAFFTATQEEYFASVRRKQEEQLRIRQLEETYGIAPEPEAAPAVPLEHTPVAAHDGKSPLALVARVQDALGASLVKVVFRFDDGPLQERTMEKFGNRRYLAVIRPEEIRGARLSYYIVAVGADGREAALWGGPDRMHELALPVEKNPAPVEKPVEKPKVPDEKTEKSTARILQAAPPFAWPGRWFASLSFSSEAAWIAKGKTTMAGAVTSNASFGGGPDATFSLEIGMFWGDGRHRTSLLGGLSPSIRREYTGETDGQPAVFSENVGTFFAFARHAWFIVPSGRFRPHLGGGLGFAQLRHRVWTDTEERTLSDVHEATGLFTDLAAGISLCLDSRCRWSIDASADLLWNAYSTIDEEKSVSNIVFVFRAGLGVTF